MRYFRITRIVEKVGDSISYYLIIICLSENIC